jgi:phosphoribosylpyrophosphate synthetase
VQKKLWFPQQQKTMSSSSSSLRELSMSSIQYPLKREAVREQVVLFACPDFQSLAESIVAVDQDDVFRLGEIQWSSFEDGFPNLLIKNVETVRGRDVVLLLSMSNPELVFSRLAVMYALPRYLVRSFVIVLPFMPAATMERIDYEGQVATASTMIHLLCSTPPSAQGQAKVVIYDIHSLSERFYFHSAVPVLVSALPLFMRWLKANCAKKADARDDDDDGNDDDDEPPLAIAFPDEGARKRFAGAFSSRYPIVTCSKKRVGDRREISVTEGDPSGRHVFIVDDLVMTGSTLIEAKNALLAQGAVKVSAFVTHAVFPRSSWQRFALASSQCKTPFHRFVVTESVPAIAAELQQVEPFVVLPLARDLNDTLKRYFFQQY